MKRPTEQPWWVNAHERPEWFTDLCNAFVDAGLCAWDARGKPHPQEYALVAMHFMASVPSAGADE